MKLRNIKKALLNKPPKVELSPALKAELERKGVVSLITESLACVLGFAAALALLHIASAIEKINLAGVSY